MVSLIFLCINDYLVFFHLFILSFPLNTLIIVKILICQVQHFYHVCLCILLSSAFHFDHLSCYPSLSNIMLFFIECYKLYMKN